MFPDILLVVLGLSVVIYLIISIEHKKNLKQLEQKTLKKLSQHGEVEIKNNQIAFRFKNKSYQVIFFYLPNHHELTINSKHIWEIKNQSKSRLVNQSKYLSQSLPQIIIVYPSIAPIKRHINENELEFVKYHQSFHNMYVVKISEIDQFLKGE